MTSELRIKIAESLGWKFHPTPVGGACVNNWEMPNGGYCADCPNWPEDANAALQQLVEVLKKEGWSAHLDNMNDSLWECDFMRNREFYSASAPALPEAICLAYCAVKSIQTDK